MVHINCKLITCNLNIIFECLVNKLQTHLIKNLKDLANLSYGKAVLPILF